ncbi:MAG: glycosyltransferase family 4 protein [Flavobacterium sp.]
MVKTILISQSSLPYGDIGSWTTLYKNYFSNYSRVDYILCPKPTNEYMGIVYSYVKQPLFKEFRLSFLSRKKIEFINALAKIITDDQKYVIQLVDDYGLVKPLNDFLNKRGIRHFCYIQFFYHGFEPYQQSNSYDKFYSCVDEIVVLTKLSYNSFRNRINILPNNFSVLHNGIDTAKFETISKQNKLLLKRELGIEDKKIFLWCSQDRPKKGLNLILDAWSKVYSENQNIILLIIGCEPRSAVDGVKFLGRIPNDELPKYYQTADCYLFPTLCHEGFGMSLIEALHCGCYCIASKLGGVPEVLEYGKYGKLIENPHFVTEWVDAINEFLEGELSYSPLPKELYSTNAWNDGMNNIIEEAKIRLDTRIAK